MIICDTEQAQINIAILHSLAGGGVGVPNSGDWTETLVLYIVKSLYGAAPLVVYPRKAGPEGLMVTFGSCSLYKSDFSLKNK